MILHQHINTSHAGREGKVANYKPSTHLCSWRREYRWKRWTADLFLFCPWYTYPTEGHTWHDLGQGVVLLPLEPSHAGDYSENLLGITLLLITDEGFFISHLLVDRFHRNLESIETSRFRQLHLLAKSLHLDKRDAWCIMHDPENSFRGDGQLGVDPNNQHGLMGFDIRGLKGVTHKILHDDTVACCEKS